MTLFKILLATALTFFNLASYSQDENLSPKWKEVFSKYNDIQKLCVKKGLDFYKLKITSMDPNVQLVDPIDPKVKPVYDTCEKFFSKQLRVDQPCNMKNEDGSSSKSICSDQYIVEKDGKKLGTTIDRAIGYAFDGIPLTIGFIESKENREARLKSYEESKAKSKNDEKLIVAEPKPAPKPAPKPVLSVEAMSADDVIKCSQSAWYFSDLGKNENYNFGSQYVTPYSSLKWQTARLMSQFYFNLSQKIPAQLRDSLANKYNQPAFRSKEIADNCQLVFDAAPQKLKNDAFNDSPFFSDPQKTTMVCEAVGNSIMNLRSAVGYFEDGVVAPTAINAFGYCINSSHSKNIRDFLQIHDLNKKNVRFMGSFRMDGKIYFSDLTQFSKYSNVSYFPDLK